ncbi:hypothetical protein [Sulfurospirillum diekertiae]|uniref:Cytochrome c n=1 Tax=Sulfurospirillum diekertiae TaxID=1854492 RepID=A0A1Y0HPL5_9BACT|nr:hypothetical protein [Sulfurospirillum diekertiae]ARU49496.1 hypothetical protein Sdiek1_2345 [Sulfurospirillum diekertiae]ASC94302.1 hypothetical protein Sdiek2_2295 [Sulfurospirillum diekertiae]
MKRFQITMILASLSLVYSLNAAEEIEKINAVVMLNMENGLANIQKGFLYNNMKLVQDGIEQVEKENSTYDNRNAIKAFLPEGKKQMENLAFISSKRIDNAAKEMKYYLSVQQPRKAFSAFSDIVNACTDCHTLVRGW